jgi:hypothetical protein
MRELVSAKVRTLLTIGSAAERITSALEGATEIVPAGDMQHAIEGRARTRSRGHGPAPPACQASINTEISSIGRALEELVRALR